MSTSTTCVHISLNYVFFDFHVSAIFEKGCSIFFLLSRFIATTQDCISAWNPFHFISITSHNHSHHPLSPSRIQSSLKPMIQVRAPLMMMMMMMTTTTTLAQITSFQSSNTKNDRSSSTPITWLNKIQARPALFRPHPLSTSSPKM